MQFGVILCEFYVIMFFWEVGPKSKEGDTRIRKSSQRRYALAITLLRHAHAHMHALHNVHMRVPYGTESLPKTSLADAALHGCSLTRRSNMA